MIIIRNPKIFKKNHLLGGVKVRVLGWVHRQCMGFVSGVLGQIHFWSWDGLDCGWAGTKAGRANIQFPFIFVLRVWGFKSLGS